MKVLFLDVDGVLNSHSDFRVWADFDGFPHIVNLDKVDRLVKIINETGCKIVLSSSWRNSQYGYDTLKKLNYFEIFDCTPRHHYENNGRKYTCRGAEIQDWLDRNPCTNYAIVDDDSDMLDSQLRHFVQTDPEYGLTETLAYRITYLLNHGARHIYE